MKNATKAIHGFTTVVTHLKRSLTSPEFRKDIHNILVEAVGTSKEDPVLLGAVDSANNLPKWFPYKVQYQFAGCEYHVNRLVLIANNHRTIFLVEGHPHDLATLFATYSQDIAGRQKVPEINPVVSSPTT